MPSSATLRCDLPDDIEAVTQQFSAECDAAAVGMKPRHKQSIWSLVESLYRTGMYSAISFCMRRHGKVVINRGIGYQSGNAPGQSLHSEAPLVASDHPICLFSASKMVTAMLVHHLDEQGLLNLMDPVGHYLPKFAVTGKQELTLHHLLTHRGGIPDLPKIIKVEELCDLQKATDLIGAQAPKWSSGQSAGYHALTGGFVLGAVIEKVSGQSLKSLLAETIQKPMGMRYFNYGLDPEDYRKAAKNCLTGVPANPIEQRFMGRLIGMPSAKLVELSNMPGFYEATIPAGNIMATSEEVSRFLQMMLNMGTYEGKQIFKPLTIRRATQEVGRPTFDRVILAPMKYSAGFMLGNNPFGLWGPYSKYAYGHIGFTNNFCWADRQRDIAVSFLTTGKPVMGPQIPYLFRLSSAICRHCKPIVKF